MRIERTDRPLRKIFVMTKIVFTIVYVMLATVALVSSSKILANINLSLHTNSFVNGVLKHQLFALSIALVAVLLTLIFTPESKKLLRFGDLNAIAQPLKWMGINGKNTWGKEGLQLTLFISLATGIFMFLAVKSTNSLQNFSWSFMPLVLLISLTNSCSEEILYRFVINGNLSPLVSTSSIFMISAILFGLPHYFGYPSGGIGMLMAGVLGYILSKATNETQGIGIAWVIHFIQDVIIMSALFMMNKAL